MNIKILNELDKMVDRSLKGDEIPVGAVIFDNNDNIIASASNNRQKKCNVLGHAEINAIIKAEKIIGDWRLDGYSMIVNLEPCDMCSSIIKESRLDKVYYFLGNNSINNSAKIQKQLLEENDYLIYKEKYKNRLSTYFKNKR